ncbi:MAG: alanine racemase, partial [Oscillospiraceae bacterium]|nr:alanine racemase [Oscillospiraceae bacterium]
KCEGIFTHFASSEDLGEDFTGEQFDLFQEIIKILERDNIYFKIKHAANSGAAINFKNMHLDYVRPGLILYGLYPGKNMIDIGLVPAMQLKAVISQVHIIRQGETVSYNRTYTAERDIKAATLPIGYADGLSRLLSNSGSVLVNGRHAPIIGRVCMDQSVIDVTDCPDVKAGDIATVFGRDNGECISAEQVADMMGTINYETVCLIGKRVPRVYYENGREVGRLNYIAGKN